MEQKGRTFFCIIINTTILFIVFFSLAVTNAGAANKVVKKSGHHNRNIHTVDSADPSVEIVRGHVYDITNDDINMDGESFSMKFATLVNEKGGILGRRDIYPGVTAEVVYVRGRIDKIIFYDIHRPAPPPQKTPPTDAGRRR